MRKVAYLLALGALLLGPWTAWAETTGQATGTLDIRAVINIDVSPNNIGTLTITQNDIAGWSSGTTINWSTSISVTVKAITQFRLYASYYAEEDGDLVHFGDDDQLIWFNDLTDPIKYYKPDNPSNPDYGSMTQLAYVDHNNIADPFTEDYTVYLKPEYLGDRHAGEVITFTFFFAVEDPST